MSLGSMIRQRRRELGLTQQRVAGRAGISKPYLSNVETGRAANPPTDGVLRALEAALGFVDGELTRAAHLARTPLDIRQEHDSLEAEVHKLRAVLREFLAGGNAQASGAIDVERLGERLEACGTEGDVGTIAAGALVPVINRPADGYPEYVGEPDHLRAVAAEYVRCPDLHDQPAFAVRVVGDSMAPQYNSGDIVVFGPGVNPDSGQDCFVQFREGGTDFKRYYRDGKRSIRLQPLNSRYPAKTYDPHQIAGLWAAVFRLQQLPGPGSL